MSRIEVAVAAPLSYTLSYSCDMDEVGDPVGRRVLVPMGRQRLTGYVLSLQPEEDVTYRILPVLRFMDETPIFPQNLVAFFRWIANYYHFPIGQVIKTALPGGLTQRNRKIIRVTETGVEALKTWGKAQKSAPDWLEKLLGKGELSAAVTKKVLANRSSKKLFEEWNNSGMVDVVDVLDDVKTGEKRELCYQRLANVGTPEKLRVPLARALSTIDILAREQGQQTIAARDIRKRYSGASKALLELETLGLISSTQRRVYRNPFGETLQFFPEPETLSAEQNQVLSEILPAIEKEEFHTFLLHGVTGCGKTEVYLRATAKTLEQGRDVLVLVPEIALATQLEAHFVSRFGDQVVLLHSGLSKGERFDQWSLAASGKAKIVIGARSAVFAPLASPGLIVVDEEHDTAYKQATGLQYQGRDLAILRAHFNKSVVILGSGTPAISSFAKTEQGKFSLLTMAKRVENRPLPDVEIVDLRDKKTKKRGDAIGLKLQEELARNLEEKKQTILLLNRRGFSSTFLCRDCGEPVTCRHCHVSLTYHKRRAKLVCHYCGFSLNENIICAACKSHNMIPVGFGTERVEQEVREKFPEARIARIDSDTAADRRKFLALLKKMHGLEIDILIGTQMIAKGHDFPNVTLVGVIWADGGLSIPDFRGAERTYQLLSQVIGRAGRGESPGRVIVQTLRPEHYAIQFAQKHDYPSLYKKEMEIRKNPNFPPYLRMVNIKISGIKEGAVQSTAGAVAKFCRMVGEKSVEILGPAPSPIDRIRDRYRWQILLKGSDSSGLHRICSRIIDEYSTLARGDIRISIDVDPESMM